MQSHNLYPLCSLIHSLIMIPYGRINREFGRIPNLHRPFLIRHSLHTFEDDNCILGKLWHSKTIG